jgi:DNA-(apurinic or apyrimidinic site) lyase
MLPFLKKFGYGPFATLMVVTGLNDYQLKGKADVAYWPKIRGVLEISPTPKSPKNLCDILLPFYQKERLNSIKIQRLNRFLDSSLADRLWQSSPQEVSRIFPDIWKELAKIMGQKPQDKTISFAMKCLELSLLIVDEHKFDFTKISIPVDSRVVRFTRNAGLCIDETSQEIRNMWNEILSLLREHYPNITMIHLDSLIWQIASMDDKELRMYFEYMNTPQVGVNLSTLLQTESTSESDKIEDVNDVQYEASMFQSNIKQDKVICFIPCCLGKDASGNIIKPERILSVRELPNTWNSLLEGRKKMQYCIEINTPKTTAINLYTGKFYIPLSGHINEIIKLIQSNRLSVIIISAGCGIVDALKPIHKYDAKMQGKIAINWKRAGLSNIIAEVILNQNPKHVYGFFGGESDWYKSSSKYRYFFTEGLKIALKNGFKSDISGCFYNIEGGGFPDFKKLKNLGKIFIEFMNSNFDDSYVKNIYKNGRWDRNIKFRFDKISI